MKVCVSCQQDVSAKKAMPVKEDRIIKGIRAAKKLLGIAQMNELFVCEECMQKHLERRRSFEKTMLFASVFAGLLLVIIILVPLLSGRFDPWAVVSGVIVALFILTLPVFKYAPAVEGVSANAFKMAAKPAAAPSATPAQPAGEAQKKRKKKK
ncbi:MAG: hypothetical protein AB1529_08310 [Candidatus Micrarchaeota archaeon]